MYYSKDYSTRMLIQHVRSNLKQVYNNHLEARADAKFGSENKANVQWSLQPFENCLYHLDGSHIPATSLLLRPNL